MADPPELGSIPEGYFTGASHITDGELRRLLNRAAIVDKVRARHEPIVTGSRSVSSPGQGPQPVISGALFLLGFTVGTDDAFREFKVPANFVGNPAVHVHWTKTTDVVELGKAVKWRVEYVVFSGAGGDGAIAPSVVEYEDTYDDGGTTTRIIHRTPDLPLVGFVAGYYVSLRVRAIAPTGTALAAEPGLFSVDLTYDERINT